MLKKITLFTLLVFGAIAFCNAQFVQTPPASPKASVSEWIGLSKVTIDYHRPGVKGREGKIFAEGGMVPNGAPWRAGADENTTISFAEKVTINGEELAAGTYGFHVIPNEDEWILVFSNNNYSWGSFAYDESEDALRVNAKPKKGGHTEWLEFRFVNQTNESADIELSWESMSVSFTVKMDVFESTLASIERELDGVKGFGWQGWISAAQYCLNNDKELEKGLVWANNASGNRFGSQKNFTTLQTKAQILGKLDRNDESKKVMDEALTLATMTDLHFYGRSLIQSKQAEEAMKIFQMNRDKNPEDNFTTLVGMARGNMALEKYKEAADYFRKAAPNAPPGQTTAYEGLAKQCEDKISDKP